MTRRAIKGALRNFLMTYASRNSDYGGYWLFGFITAELPELHIDLSVKPEDRSPTVPLDAAVWIARQRFWRQIDSAKVALRHIREAKLWVTRQPEPPRRTYGRDDSHEFIFHALVTTDRDVCIEDKITILVAPHDAQREIRSTRPHLSRQMHRTPR
jgi:hypothetical protein